MSAAKISEMGLVGFGSIKRIGNAVNFAYENGWARITVYQEDIIRVQAGPRGTTPQGEGYAVQKREWADVPFELRECADHIEMVTGKLVVSLQMHPLCIRFKDVDGKVITSGSPAWNGPYSVSRHASHVDEHFFGFGLQFHKLDQRGLYRTIKTNADPPNDNGMAHAPDPFFYSTSGYGVFLNSYGYSQFDMCATKPDEYTFSAPEPTLDYFFIYGPSFRRISERQTWLRGRTQMPPKWGLGFWYRMPSAWKADQTIEAAQEFRARGIPCDVVGLEPTWQTHTYPCTYVWNREYYPDPAGYVQWMRDNGFHVNLWEHEWVHESSPIFDKLRQNGLLADKKAMGGAIPDFTLQQTRDIFADIHMREHIELGIDGYKLDECDGSDFTGNWFYPDDTRFPSGLTGAEMHNLTGFLYNQTVQEMFAHIGLRTYLLLRANFAGGQRYSSCIYSDYYQLEQYIRAQATSGFSGFLWCPELREAGSNDEFLRRAQNMFFAPMAMINAWAGDSELLPWNRDEACEQVFRRYAQLRMRLLPYIYSSFRAMNTTGLPIVRALVMDYPEDRETYLIDDQFMFGEFLMVAPLARGVARSIYLPEGRWTDFWTDYVYEGGRRIEYDADSDVLPVFVKAGAVIPMGPVMQYVGEVVVDEIELHIYSGESSFVFYDDDGTTTRYLDGAYLEVPMEVSEKSVSIGEAMGDYQTAIRSFLVKMHGASRKEIRVTLGEQLTIDM